MVPAKGPQQRSPKVGPLLDRDFKSGGQGRLMQAELQRLGLTQEELAADFKDWKHAQQQQAHA